MRQWMDQFQDAHFSKHIRYVLSNKFIAIIYEIIWSQNHVKSFKDSSIEH